MAYIIVAQNARKRVKIMTEFNQGIFEFLKRVIAGSSVGLAVVYTLGHIVIAMSCISRT